MWINIIAGLAFLSVIPIVIACLFRSSNSDVKSNKVYLPKFYFWAGLFIAGSMILSIIYSLTSPDVIGVTWWVLLVLVVVVFNGISIILASVNWEIRFDENGFSYRTFLGITYKFSYQDVIEIRRKGYGIIILTNRRRLIIDKYAIGIREFILAFDEAYLRAKKK